MRPAWAALPFPAAPLDGPASWWLIASGAAVVVLALAVWAWRARRRSRGSAPLEPHPDAAPASQPGAVADGHAAAPSPPAPLLVFPEARGPRRGAWKGRLGVVVAAAALLSAAGFAAAPLLSRALAPAPVWQPGAGLEGRDPQAFGTARPGRTEGTALRVPPGGSPRAAEPWTAPARPAGAGPARSDLAVSASDASDAGDAGGVADHPSAVDPETGDRLILWAGDGQRGRPGEPLRRGLTVVLHDSAGRPLPDREVTFTVANGGGRVDPAQSRTSELGLALARWWPGSDPDSLSVIAAVADRPALTLRFRARLDPAAVAVLPAEPDSTAAEDTTADAETAPAPPPPVATPRPGAPLAAGGVHTCWLEAPQNGAPPTAVACRGGPGARAALPRLSADGPPPPVRGLEAGIFRLCAMAGRDGVACWSLSPEPGSPSSPVVVRVPGGAGVVDLAVGSEHACALGGDGVARCWGTNTRGQLGNGTSTDAASPVRVAGLPAAVQLAGGWLHGCALTAAGRAYCWGANGTGQLGDGTTTDRARAVPVGHDAPFTMLTAGSGHTCGLTPAGEGWCWGDNAHGQLGTGTRGVAARPTPVDTRLRFRTLVAGSVHTCGLTGDGRAWCWGRNTFGQLGDGSTLDSPIPVPVAGDLRFTTLTAGGAHACGATATGDLYCWGNNTHGQLGDGTRDHRTDPTRVNR